MRRRPALAIGMLRDRRGAVAAHVAIVLPLLLIALAAAFDMGSAYVMRTMLQNTADAAALAGASAVPDETAAKTRALAAATANMAAAANGNVLVDANVVMGHWDAATRTFTPDDGVAGGLPADAVQVTTLRTQANGNPLPTVFAGIFGLNFFEVSARAVATIGGGEIPECLLNGFLADGQFQTGSNVTITGDTCVHGQAGIEVGSNVTVHNTAEVTRGEGSEFKEGSNTSMEDPTVRDTVVIPDGEIDRLLDAIRDKTAESPFPPDWPVVDLNGADLESCNPTPDTVYIAKEAKLGSCTGLLRDFGVYATDKITLPSGNSGDHFEIKNMYFASEKGIELGSNLDIGSSYYCTSGLDSVFFIAHDYIKFGSDVNMWGVQIMAGASGPTSTGIEIGDDFDTTAVAAWSDGFLKLGSAPDVEGGESTACDQDNHVHTQHADLVLRLVD